MGTGNGSFMDRLSEARLTKTGRRIAEYLTANSYAVAFYSLETIAAKLSISDISIVRFSRALGYGGFSEMKQAVQSELISRIDEYPESVNSVAKYISNKELAREDHIFSAEKARETYTEILQRSLEGNSNEIYEEAAQRLIAADRKYIVGLQSRVTAADSLCNLLHVLLPNVEAIVSGGYPMYLRLIDMRAEDCLVLFSFGRLTKTEKEVLGLVKASGAYLIVISDQKDTPSAQAADLLIYSCANTSHFFYSNVSNVMITEMIASTVAAKTWEESRDRLSSIDDYLNSQRASAPVK